MCCVVSECSVSGEVQHAARVPPPAPGLAGHQCQVRQVPGPRCQASHCSCSCDNVLMVIGGQYFNATTRLHDMVHQVEVLGPRGSCEVTETHSRQLL